MGALDTLIARLRRDLRALKARVDPDSPGADLYYGTNSSGTKGFHTLPSGGGGGGTPSSTVVSETAYGQSATAGSASSYARGDHTHGTPSLSSSTPAALGTAAAGTATSPARADHVHAMPSASDVGADPSGTASSAVATHAAAADPHPGYALESALGTAAALDVGTGAGDVAAGDAPAAAQAAAESTAAAALATHAGDTGLHLGTPSNTDLNGAYGRNFDITPVGASVASPGVTLATGGTVTAQIDTDGKVWARFTANAAQFAGIRGSANNFLIMASGGTFTFRMRMPSSASSRRLWIGWQSVLVGSSATPAGRYAGLMMDSQTGGSLVCYAAARDGTTFSTTSTGVTLAADTEYYGTVRISSSGVYVAIAAAGASLPAETAHTTNLPGSTTQLGPVVGLYGGGTHSLDVRGACYNVGY